MHKAPWIQVLLIGIGLLVIGSLLASSLRGLASRNAGRAIESATWTEGLPGHVPPRKLLLRQLRDERARRQVVATIVGVMFVLAGVVFVLAAFGVGGPVYTNCC